MFVDVSVILARTKPSIFFFDKEKGGGLGGIGGMNCPRGKVLIKDVLGSFSLFRGKGVYFPDLQGESVVKVNLVVIESRWGNVVSGLLGEHGGEQRVFWGECRFGFGFFGGSGEFGGSG